MWRSRSTEAGSRLAFNADDFGLSHEFNSGIMAAHSAGCIGSASLMMAESATAEAIELARSTPSLRVGIHIALSDATPFLLPAQIPRLVDEDGRFYHNEAALRRAMFSKEGREQIRCEIRAQIDAFFATGLPCDHINTHRHCHLLPHVAMILADESQQRSIRRTRLPLNHLIKARGAANAIRTLRFRVIKSILRSRGGFAEIYTGISSEDWTAEMMLEALEKIPTNRLIDLSFHPTAQKNHPFSTDLPMLLEPRVTKAIHAMS